ncbi:hypothetical protein C900_04613 [Fulvivirga imtechensis AK7]|uniref:Uncharacterized protein n=1 Tax=Fulvivirga imtechensis AK7 TaxID=1237149 RepID=L8JLH7_9BACT|nr:hypothetical protein [Fulvivirga imtechensis]ELR69766.1 hypothetical protein C900_04613 [Fulvivirga imtechensis AK7]
MKKTVLQRFSIQDLGSVWKRHNYEPAPDFEKNACCSAKAGG